MRKLIGIFGVHRFARAYFLGETDEFTKTMESRWGTGLDAGRGFDEPEKAEGRLRGNRQARDGAFQLASAARTQGRFPRAYAFFEVRLMAREPAPYPLGGMGKARGRLDRFSIRCPAST